MTLIIAWAKKVDDHPISRIIFTLGWFWRLCFFIGGLFELIKRFGSILISETKI